MGHAAHIRGTRAISAHITQAQKANAEPVYVQHLRAEVARERSRADKAERMLAEIAATLALAQRSRKILQGALQCERESRAEEKEALTFKIDFLIKSRARLMSQLPH